MSTSPLTLAIVITYNGSHFIRNCLDMLARNIDGSDIIVIDNGSADDTVTLIEENYKGLVLIKLDRNCGFGKANNIGLQLAIARNADYVFLLNQDVYVEDQTIPRLVEIARRHQDYGIISPLHLNGKGNGLDNNFSRYVSAFLISDLCLGKCGEIYSCRFINAAAWLLSRECIARVGGFDPLFFHYGEDDDYVNRTHYHKMKIGVCPHLSIRHDRGSDNALAGYPEEQRIYLEALKNLKNINLPFNKVVKGIFIGCASQTITALVFFRLRHIYTILRTFFRILSRIHQIHAARIESKIQCSFINKNYEKQECVPVPDRQRI